jgi:hypothetical protein
MSLIALLAALAASQIAPASAPVAPSEGPWRMLISVPYDPGQPRMIFWILASDIAPDGEGTGAHLAHTFSFRLDDQGRPEGADRRTSSVSRYDCDAGTVQTLETTRIDGETVTRESDETEPSPVVPHTADRVVLGVVCGDGVPSVAPTGEDVAGAWREQEAILERWAAASN